jgi:hypothetical protein
MYMSNSRLTFLSPTIGRDRTLKRILGIEEEVELGMEEVEAKEVGKSSSSSTTWKEGNKVRIILSK